MTITPELKEAVERSGEGPIRVVDLETQTAYVLIREDVYRKMIEQTAIDHSDRSLYEFGEFHPDE